MKLEEFKAAEKILNEVKKIDNTIELLNNRYDNFIATSYKKTNVLVRESIVIDNEMKNVIIKHLSDKKELKLKEFSEI